MIKGHLTRLDHFKQTSAVYTMRADVVSANYYTVACPRENKLSFRTKRRAPKLLLEGASTRAREPKSDALVRLRISHC